MANLARMADCSPLTTTIQHPVSHLTCQFSTSPNQLICKTTLNSEQDETSELMKEAAASPRKPLAKAAQEQDQRPKQKRRRLAEVSSCPSFRAKWLMGPEFRGNDTGFRRIERRSRCTSRSTRPTSVSSLLSLGRTPTTASSSRPSRLPSVQALVL